MTSGSPDSLNGRTSRYERSFTACVPIHLLVIGALRRPATVERVTAEIEIAPVSAAEYEELLPLIAAYQRFYEVEEIDEERNRAFFRRFLTPSDDGMLVGAGAAGELVGYACLYWHFSSLSAAESVLMNDLFVSEAARGRGVGRALIEASADVARERGAAHLEWATAPDNLAAQRLYDSTGAERSEWVEYELGL
jgi:GNAT superfamily N-acetyltransferase